MKPVDYIVATLTLTICLFMGATAVYHLYYHDGTNADQNKLVVGFLSTIVAIISIYVGAKIKDQ